MLQCWKALWGPYLHSNHCHRLSNWGERELSICYSPCQWFVIFLANMWLQLSVLSSVSCFLPFAICNVHGASSESEGLHGRWWPLGELVCGGLVSGWSLAVMGIFWCFQNYSGFSFLWSKALKWSPWALLAFAPLICVPTLLSNFFIVFLYLVVTVIFCSFLFGFFFVLFVFFFL